MEKFLYIGLKRLLFNFILFIFYTILLLFKLNVNLKVDWIKYFTFYIFIFMMLINAKLVSSYLFSITSEQFKNIINYIIYIFAAGAFFALLGYSAFGKILELIITVINRMNRVEYSSRL